MDHTTGTAYRPEHRTEDRSQVLRYAQQMIADNRGELNRADLKASQAMAAAGVVAMGLITAMTSRTWSPSYADPAAAWLWWLGCALWAVAVAALVLALVPRLGARGAAGERLRYLGDVHRYRLASEVHDALVVAARQPLDLAIREVSWTSTAVLRKYRMVRIGVLALGAATMLFAASGLR